ncbi:bifunctional 2-polyprenyl-6-hydroxyphenol methylase/3-demethylubiquinol 3-O-methyltransferase UbiG [Inquilinus sp. Marseille-Q2685]|uniref:class I SAM-dependent methyltransferase n=1 Tax=Inquilinus sp. Marseille-Q2685 TaxID=2866581 RepID=UPI001CE44C34|nr:class I SAM-dependent methyltransferase [Inquilinus sp. Marseille-Q2685]
MTDAPQNIYDDPTFFAGYAALRDAESGLNAVLEQPALARLLPASLAGLRILDLGCGFGDFARKARAQGAASVLGVDVSAKMLAEARRRTDDPAIRYEQAAIETLAVEPGAFDLAISSLALHYVADYAGAVRKIAAALAPGGRFAFSVEHPICTAMAVYEWHRDEAGAELHWPVDRYGEEGRRDTRWFVDGGVKYHRTVASYVNGLVDAGLSPARLEEPEADPAALAARPDLALQRRRPPFLLLAADKPA